MTSPMVSIIIPVFNERDNVPLIYDAIQRIPFPYPWEIIFVDDHSPDGTIQIIRHLAQHDPRIRGIHRIGRKGLSSAVIEGALSSSAPFIAVMDGDLQHDATSLLPMVNALMNEPYELAIASRYLPGGNDQGLSNIWRRLLSQSGRRGARLFLRTSLTDPMSGFFAIKRHYFEQYADQLSGKGFKILFDLILAVPHPMRFIEFPTVFRDREHGHSKLNWKIMISFIGMILHHKRKKT